jgi:hypothetical protein
MPTLPSGLKLALLTDHIMEPDTNWFKAPKGEFWLWVPAEENPPPFSSGDVWEGVPSTAPVPISRKLMAKYIRVCIGLDNGMMYWRGEMLADFPKYNSLSEEDSAAWREWLETQPVGEYLDRAIIKCKQQAEINKEATGYVIATVEKELDDGSMLGKKLIDDPTRNSH